MTTRRQLLRAAVGAAALGGWGVPARATVATPRRYVIGRSYDDRPLLAYRLGPADAPSRYAVLGSMHGDEPAGHRLVRSQLLDRRAPAGVQLWLLPTLNPDGLAAGTRTNARGVDLNRNFPSDDWHVQDAGTRYWSGRAAASERETRAVARFLADLVPHTVVSVHQPLACVDHSGGDRAVTTWLAARLGLPARTLGASGGNLTTWFNDAHPRHTAVTLELGGSVTAGRRARVADVLVRHAAHRAQ